MEEGEAAPVGIEAVLEVAPRADGVDSLVGHQLFQQRGRRGPVDAHEIEEGHVEPGAQQRAQILAQRLGRGVAASERQQLGAQVDHELHALRQAHELAQQLHRRRFQFAPQRPGGVLARAPLVDGLHRRLPWQAVVARQGQQELLAAGGRERQVGLSQFGGPAAACGLAALAFEAGIDAALQPGNVVVGKIGPQGGAHRLAGAAGSVDESSTKSFEGTVDGIGEQQGHARIMS